jgi:hypothetical protein
MALGRPTEKETHEDRGFNRVLRGCRSPSGGENFKKKESISL